MSGSRADARRWRSSAKFSAEPKLASAIVNGMMTKAGAGSCRNAGTSVAITARMARATMPVPHHTPRVPKRPASAMIGMTSHGSSGLCGPPLSAAAIAVTVRFIVNPQTTTIAGCVVAWMPRRMISSYSADRPPRVIGSHQPTNGPRATSVTATAPYVSSRGVRRVSSSSRSRSRSPSVGQKKAVKRLTHVFSAPTRPGLSALKKVLAGVVEPRRPLP